MSFNSETTKVTQVLTTTNQAISLNGFYFQTDDQISVVSKDVLGVVTARSLTTDYTLVGAGLPTYGTLTVVGGTIGDTWYIVRDVPITQLIGWVQQGGFSMANLTAATDKAALIDLQQQEEINRCLKFPSTDTTDPVMPSIADRLGKVFTWDSITGAIKASTLVLGGLINNAISIVFDPAGTGAVATTVEAKLRRTVIDIEDFGASASNTAAENDIAIQAALDSDPNGVDLIIPPGTYDFTTFDITYPTSTIRGAGFASILNHTGTGDAITCTNSTWSGMVLEKFRLKGTSLSGHGINMDDAVVGSDDTSTAAAFMTDTTASFTTNAYVGRVIQNRTKDEIGTITANTATTVTATLGGGATWDSGDVYAIDIAGNMGNVTLENLYIDGFTKVGSAGFNGRDLYNFSFNKVQVHDCYDGIYFGSQCIGNSLNGCWLRGMTRYGFAVVGINGDESFNNNWRNGVIDEDDGSNAGIGVYFYRNNTSTVEHVHFEDLDKGIVIERGIQNRIINNQFAVNLTTASWETGVSSSNSYVEGNRYLSGAIIDAGTRTMIQNDNPYTDIGDGGGSDSRVSVGVSQTQVGYWTQDAGNGIHLQGRELRGTSMSVPNKVFGLGLLTGTDDTSTAAAFLTDSTATWTIDEHVGKTITNATDGSSGTITSNTATTATATLTGGTGNNWDSGDTYNIGASAGGAPIITESDVIKVENTATVNLDGFSSASSISGRKVTLYFADTNVTLRNGQSGTTSYYLRLDGGVSFVPAINDSITLLCLGDRTWLEVGRVVIA